MVHRAISSAVALHCCHSVLLPKLLNRVQLNPIYRILLLCFNSLCMFLPFFVVHFVASLGSLFRFGGRFIQFGFNKALCSVPKVPFREAFLLYRSEERKKKNVFIRHTQNDNLAMQGMKKILSCGI